MIEINKDFNDLFKLVNNSIINFNVENMIKSFAGHDNIVIVLGVIFPIKNPLSLRKSQQLKVDLSNDSFEDRL